MPGCGLPARFRITTDEILHAAAFLETRRPSQRQAISKLDPIGIVHRTIQQPLGETVGAVIQESAVHGEQPLGRDVGLRTLTGAGGRIHEVEETQQFRQPVTVERQVYRAPVGVFGREIGRIGARRPLYRITQLGLQGSAHRQVQGAAESENGIAHFLDRQPAAVESRPKAVARVELERLARRAAAHPVGAGVHDAPVHLFDRPTRIDELPGEVVQQSRVRGAFAHLAEIIRCADKAFTEMPQPNAIHHDPAGEGGIAGDQPVRQLPPAAALSNGGLAAACEHDREDLRDNPAAVVVAASDEDGLVDDLAFDDRRSHRGARRRG